MCGLLTWQGFWKIIKMVPIFSPKCAQNNTPGGGCYGMQYTNIINIAAPCWRRWRRWGWGRRWQRRQERTLAFSHPDSPHTEQWLQSTNASFLHFFPQNWPARRSTDLSFLFSVVMLCWLCFLFLFFFGFLKFMVEKTHQYGPVFFSSGFA